MLCLKSFSDKCESERAEPWRPVFGPDTRKGKMVNKSEMPDKELYVGRIRAAELVGVSPQLIDRFIGRGSLRAFRLGRKVVVKRAELLQLVERNEML